MTPSILIHHEHTNVVSPADQSNNTQSPSSLADSNPQKTSALPIDTAVNRASIKTSAAPKSQESFDHSVKILPCSSFAVEEAQLPAVPEMTQDNVFEPDFTSWRNSSTATVYSATAPTDSSSDTMNLSPDTDSPVAARPIDHPQRQKHSPSSSDTAYSHQHRVKVRGDSNYPNRPLRSLFPSDSEDDPHPLPRARRPASSDTDYSQEHRAAPVDSQRYPKGRLRGRLLAILRAGQALPLLTLYCLICLFSGCPLTDADPFRNAYGTVEDRYQLTAYDCSDPMEVQAYSSVPERPCSIGATPVHKTRPTRFQLLQKEKKRYLTAYSCSILRTDLRYNCGVYGHAGLDPIHWSFSVTQRVTFEQCLTWLRTRCYQPSMYSILMHGRDLNVSITLDEPNQVSYLVRGRTYTKEPSLPTDQFFETACQGEGTEYGQGHPLNHMVAYYDRVMQTVTLVVEGDEVVDQRNQWTLPCKWAE